MVRGMDDELQSSQDVRVGALWSSLDARGTGHLDLKGLKAGLRKIDHREWTSPPLSRTLTTA